MSLTILKTSGDANNNYLERAVYTLASESGPEITACQTVVCHAGGQSQC